MIVVLNKEITISRRPIEKGTSDMSIFQTFNNTFDMFLFLIKKTFFDFWDNLGAILIINLGYFAILAFTVFVPSPFPPLHILSLFTYFIKFSLFFLYTGAINRMIKQHADFSSASFSDFIPHLKASWISSFLFSSFVLGIFLIVMSSLSYLKLVTGFMAALGLSMLFWIIVICFMSLPYFFPFDARSNGNFFTCLKKAILMFIDNVLFSLGLLIGALIISGISTFFVFIIPGIGMLLLWYNVAVRLRLAKYDYLEQNPNTKRWNIPWKEILEDDMERLSSRTLKRLIFPWL